MPLPPGNEMNRKHLAYRFNGKAYDRHLFDSRAEATRFALRRGDCGELWRVCQARLTRTA